MEEHLYNVGTVYILYVQSAKTREYNILGVFQDEKTANYEIERWKSKNPGTDLFIERHSVWQI